LARASVTNRLSQLGRLGGRGASRRPALVWPFAGGRTPRDSAAFALTLRAPEDDPRRSNGVSSTTAATIRIPALEPFDREAVRFGHRHHRHHPGLHRIGDGDGCRLT
jgi:hypothetical protein